MEKLINHKSVSVSTNFELCGNVFRKGSVITPADFKANEVIARQMKETKGAVNSIKKEKQVNKFSKANIKQLDSSSDSNSDSSD